MNAVVCIFLKGVQRRKKEGVQGHNVSARDVPLGRMSPFKIGWNCPSPLHWRPWAQSPSLAGSVVVVVVADAAAGQLFADHADRLPHQAVNWHVSVGRPWFADPLRNSPAV